MGHGGKRAGAGRPKGQGLYGEETKVMRVPHSLVEEIKQFVATKSGFKIPLYTSQVKAGFPSPADDYIEDLLDLNQHLIKHPHATFIVRASGDSMIGVGIYPGSLLIVDRSLDAVHGKIVIAAVDGELTVKRFHRKAGEVLLLAENPDYPPIDISKSQETVIWGVVTSVIKEL